jgi:hypothetical protein
MRGRICRSSENWKLGQKEKFLGLHALRAGRHLLLSSCDQERRSAGFESGRHYVWEFERDGVELSVEVDGRLTPSKQDLAVRPAVAANVA